MQSQAVLLWTNMSLTVRCKRNQIYRFNRLCSLCLIWCYILRFRNFVNIAIRIDDDDIRHKLIYIVVMYRLIVVGLFICIVGELRFLLSFFPVLFQKSYLTLLKISQKSYKKSSRAIIRMLILNYR